jgi:hypothetical protein
MSGTEVLSAHSVALVDGLSDRYTAQRQLRYNQIIKEMQCKRGNDDSPRIDCAL